jgi:hypothetical protein
MIGEGRVAFKGMVIFEVYNPMKPMKWGFQVYLVAECNTDYVSSFLPCYGKPATKYFIQPDLICFKLNCSPICCIPS